ncbi:hypothetical protein V8C37DRAFT_387730, partial [Trichoderma ceciliae]
RFSSKRSAILHACLRVCVSACLRPNVHISTEPRRQVRIELGTDWKDQRFLQYARSILPDNHRAAQRRSSGDVDFVDVIGITSCGRLWPLSPSQSCSGRNYPTQANSICRREAKAAAPKIRVHVSCPFVFLLPAAIS